MDAIKTFWNDKNQKDQLVRDDIEIIKKFLSEYLKDNPLPKPIKTTRPTKEVDTVSVTVDTDVLFGKSKRKMKRRSKSRTRRSKSRTRRSNSRTRRFSKRSKKRRSKSRKKSRS